MGFGKSIRKVFKKPGGIVGSLASSIPVIGGPIAGAFSSYGEQSAADKEWERSVGMTEDARAFSERMSSSAHQREVGDLRAAGLNPILSADSGASTPSGVMGSVPDVPNVAERGVSTARDMKRLGAEMRANEANIRNTDSDTRSKDQERKIKIQMEREAAASADIAENRAFTMKNRMVLERKYPRLFGIFDSLADRAGNMIGTARDAGIFGGSLKYLFKGDGSKDIKGSDRMKFRMRGDDPMVK